MTIELSRHTDARTTAELDSVINDTRLRSAAEQTRLVMGVADLYASKKGDDDAAKAFAVFFTELVQAAAFEVRQGLSRRLGSADWIPPQLARALAHDDIEIARPVISASPLLNADDLLELFSTASTDHRLQVALRPGLCEKVSKVILDSEEPLLLTALASNVHAHLPAGGIDRLITASAQIAGLRLPLTRHPELSEQLAERLYQLVGETLREHLCNRFPEHRQQLKQAINETVATVSHTRIASTLNEGGHLTPNSLLRLLNEGRLGLFMHCLGMLAGIRVNEIEILLTKASARPFYLVCLAAGIDRASFPPLLEALRALNEDTPPPLLETELRLGERARYQAKVELRAYVESLQTSPKAH